ncbi:hypothetical protein KAR91_53915 [Candidatus Pacearchaeota archaeon]|nr:hypothetical protein [Candidatus Pacearchaeota archaeon]
MAEKTSKRMLKSQVGYTGLNQIDGRIYEEGRVELRWPENLRTFAKMSYDPTIRAANNVIDIMIGRVKWEFKARKEAPEQAHRAAEFLNYCKENMEDGHTWDSTIQEFGSYRIYGYHVSEKVYTKVKEDGEWYGKLKWAKLPTRSQSTLGRWKFDDESRRLLGVEQDLNKINFGPQYRGVPSNAGGQVFIRREKMMLFRYGTQRENPEGESPLKGCWIPWKYKSIIEEYEAVGVAKDLGGIPILEIDANYLAKAYADSNSAEAANLDVLEAASAGLHSGEQTHITIPMAYTDTGKPLFGFRLIGIDGGGKQYNVDDIIKRKQQEILMLYLADVLKLGSDSHGSFALAESKNNLLAFAIEHHLQLMSDVINNDLIPQTLAANGYHFPKVDMPQIHFKDLDDIDMDVFSKFVQRVASTGFLPRTTEIINEVLDRGGFTHRLDGDEELDETLFPSTAASKAGEGMKTPGEGTSTGGADTSDSSVSNGENT